MHTLIHKKPLLLTLLLLLLCIACNNKDKRAETDQAKNRFDNLLEYIVEEKDYINSTAVPYFIFAPEVYNHLDSNYLIIDLRDTAEYEQRHIANSVNIPLSGLLDYMENRIHPPAFEKIVLVCNMGAVSIMGAMGLKYLGYDNVYPLKNGLSSWSEAIANDYWEKHTSNEFLHTLETTPNAKDQAGPYPVIESKHDKGYDILRERIDSVFAGDYTDYFVYLEDVKQAPDSWYLITYWPDSRYESGHFPGGIQYKPRHSLHPEKYLNTLPADKPIVVQCYSGNHSAFVSFFLRVLGYDARSFNYGANAFMHKTLKEEEDKAGRHFTLEKDVFNYPMEGDATKKTTDTSSLLQNNNETPQ
ncbi:MAG: rhodanese-like domain-containing protein [Bacteroidales bacterium]